MEWDIIHNIVNIHVTTTTLWKVQSQGEGREGVLLQRELAERVDPARDGQAGPPANLLQSRLVRGDFVPDA